MICKIIAPSAGEKDQWSPQLSCDILYSLSLDSANEAYDKNVVNNDDIVKILF